MPWAACEAADKHAGGEKRSKTLRRGCCGGSPALSCSYHSQQGWARGQAPTLPLSHGFAPCPGCHGESLWGCQGFSLSPHYLVLPHQQGGTVEVAVTASEVARVVVKALTAGLGLAHAGIGLVWSWSCCVVMGQPQGGAGKLLVTAQHGSPWAHRWQGHRAAWWELQLQELPQEGGGLPNLGDYHTWCGAHTGGRTVYK